MADILIRGMEMPKGCWDCPCSDKRRAVCGITGFGIWFSYRRRSKDCENFFLRDDDDEYGVCTEIEWDTRRKNDFCSFGKRREVQKDV